MLPQKAFKYTLADHGDQFADPVQVRRDLLRVSAGRLWDWVNEARQMAADAAMARASSGSGDSELEQAKLGRMETALAEREGQIVAAAYEAFGLPRFDRTTGSGILEAEARSVLVAFLEYAEGKG